MQEVDKLTNANKPKNNGIRSYLYIDNATCIAITSFYGFITTTATGIVFGASLGGIDLLTSSAIALKGVGAKIIGGIGSFCATNPWAISIIAFIGAWIICNQDNFLILGGNIVRAALTGKGVECGVSWFQVWSEVR